MKITKCPGSETLGSHMDTLYGANAVPGRFWLPTRNTQKGPGVTAECCDSTAKSLVLRWFYHGISGFSQQIGKWMLIPQPMVVIDDFTMFDRFPAATAGSSKLGKVLNQSSTFRFHKGTIGNGHSRADRIWMAFRTSITSRKKGRPSADFVEFQRTQEKQAEGWKTAIIQQFFFSPWFVELYQQNTLWENCVLSWLLEFTSVCPMWRTMARKVSNCFLFYVRNSISPAWGG